MCLPDVIDATQLDLSPTLAQHDYSALNASPRVIKHGRHLTPTDQRLTMKLRKPLLVLASASVVLVSAALPAAADTTTTTFSLTGGSLTLSVAANATLTNEAAGVAANTITGTLGEVAVNDARGGTAGWVASAASTTFTGTGLSVSNGVTYTNGTVTESGTNTIEAADADSITATTPVATATDVSGFNTASWNPTLNVSMPASALAGAYTGTVTTSLL